VDSGRKARLVGLFICKKGVDIHCSSKKIPGMGGLESQKWGGGISAWMVMVPGELVRQKQMHEIGETEKEKISKLKKKKQSEKMRSRVKGGSEIS